MSIEVELKLWLPPRDAHRLAQAQLLAGAIEKKKQELISIYYDTPTLSLHRRGIALRLRRQGRAWLQTVKCANELGAGEWGAGLSARPEWETAYSGRFDFTPIDDAGLRDWLARPRLLSRLEPVFEVKVRRTTWHVEPQAQRALLVSLDQGSVSSGGRRAPISEVEIELARGDVADVFDAALALGADVALIPQTMSKAERGYRLRLDAACEPVKFSPPAPAGHAGPASALRALLISCLAHQQANVEGMMTSEDPEYIHQMRVAGRRLNAATRMFKPAIPAELAAGLDDALAPMREAMRRLGEVRDLDVLSEDVVAPVAAALPEERAVTALRECLWRRRQAARARARRYVLAPEFGRVQIGLLALLHKPAFGSREGQAELREFVIQRLQRLRKKLSRLAKEAAIDDPAALHRTRIGVKRLRYALDFASALFPAYRPGRAPRQLARIQDRFGALNDLANAPSLLEACARNGPARAAIALVGGWHAARQTELLARVASDLKTLRRIELPDIGRD